MFINLCIADSRNHGNGGGVLFSTENAKFAIFRPILAILSRIYALFDVLFTGGGVPKLTNIRYDSDEFGHESTMNHSVAD